jgi:hypothetical protein
MEPLETFSGFGNFTENSYEGGNVENCIEKGKMACITLGISHLTGERDRFDPLSSLLKHFCLKVENFQAAVGDTACDLNAENAGSGSNLQHL